MQSLYQLMLDCWEIELQLRPSMKEVVSRLASACAGVSRDMELDLEKAFDSRWDAAGRKSMLANNGEGSTESLSASLNNLHGSLDNLELELTGRKEVVSANDNKSESGFSAKGSSMTFLFLFQDSFLRFTVSHFELSRIFFFLISLFRNHFRTFWNSFLDFGSRSILKCPKKKKQERFLDPFQS